MESKARKKTGNNAKVMPDMTAWWAREELGGLFFGRSAPLIVESSASFNPTFKKRR
jgi:hypothetical protein